ncbi:MAG: rRNA pseudouridine synthase [Candidatus Magasanikbacteria bacterium]|nr:rRNA pseudouridine synthase [Candidatus Magasanikbacteria bacterium]
MRLNKFLAQSGLCSRRRADEFIEAGKITVNGKQPKHGVQIDPKKDEVKFRDKIIKLSEEELIYIIVNKPVGYITTTTSDQGKSVLELLKAKYYYAIGGKRERRRVFPVGRLDKDSEGLVLLTNDGDLTEKLSHPRFEHEKEYEILIDEDMSEDDIENVSKQMQLGDDNVKGAKIKEVKKVEGGYAVYLVLKEGKNRQIRRMFGRLGHNIRKLKRIRINKLELGKLPVGQWRYVEKSEII